MGNDGKERNLVQAENARPRYFEVEIPQPALVHQYQRLVFNWLTTPTFTNTLPNLKEKKEIKTSFDKSLFSLHFLDTPFNQPPRESWRDPSTQQSSHQHFSLSKITPNPSPYQSGMSKPTSLQTSCASFTLVFLH